MQVRIIVPVKMHGNVQLLQGQIVPVPETLGQAFIDAKEAVLVPLTEQAVMHRPTPTLLPRPKPTARPKPETRTSRSRSR